MNQFKIFNFILEFLIKILKFYQIVSPSGKESDCFLQAIDEDSYEVQFILHEVGIHYLHVKLDDIHVQGSPYKICVDDDQPSVQLSGDGLRRCRVGMC